ncbi:hypothetical protein GCM10027578_27750 [Spirosoma luteolum]
MISALLSTLCCGNSARDVTGPPAQWRNLQFESLPRQSICYYFHRRKLDGTIEKLNAALNQADRIRAGRAAFPSLLYIDYKSIKIAPMGSQARGLYVHKAVNRRKRLWMVGLQGANQADGPAAVELIGHVLWRCGERLEVICGD